MRLLQRARASYALSLVLCAVLLGAMAVPAMAAGDARSERASQAQDNKAKGKAKAQEKKDAERGEASAESSSASSSKSSSEGKSSSAAKSSNASSQGQSASAAKSGNGSAKSGGSASAAAQASGKGDKPAKAEKQGEAKAGENSPAGNKGSMKVRPVGTAAHPPRNYAHLPCVVQVDFYGSPHAGATLTAVSHAPTAPTGQTLLTQTMSFSQPSPNPRGNELVGTTTLDFTSVVSGLTYHEQQGYHVKLTAVQDGPQGGDVKHKVFWIDCAAPAAEDTAEEQVGTEDAAVLGSEVEVETENATAEVQGVSDAVDTEVAGVTVERGEAVAAEGRVLGASGAVAPRNNARVLAATGLGVLALTLLGLVGLGGGAGMLRRFRKM